MLAYQHLWSAPLVQGQALVHQGHGACDAHKPSRCCVTDTLAWHTRQATALAYAQREVVEASLGAVQSVPGSLAAPLRKLVLLYALRCLQAEAAWLLTQELISLPMARALPGMSASLLPMYLLCLPACTRSNLKEKF